MKNPDPDYCETPEEFQEKIEEFTCYIEYKHDEIRDDLIMDSQEDTNGINDTKSD